MKKATWLEPWAFRLGVLSAVFGGAKACGFSSERAGWSVLGVFGAMWVAGIVFAMSARANAGGEP